jgi:hypothetical protein
MELKNSNHFSLHSGKIPVFWIIIFTILLTSCGSGGDYTKKLSGSYIYRHEGSPLNEIFSEDPTLQGIPGDVINYSFNDDYIIAKQRPNETPDPLEDRVILYKNGTNYTYYWIIVHKNKSIIGPLDLFEFQGACNKYNVPKSLNFDN